MPSKKQPQHANDDEEDDFFESFDRIPSSISVDITASSDDDEDFDDFDDARLSFASAVAPPSPAVFSTSTTTADYNVWMSEPMSIKERRLLLLKGMGLSPASSKDLFIRGGGASSASVAATLSDSPQSFPSSASSAARTRLPSPPVILRSRSDVATLLAHSALIRRVSSAPSLLLSVPRSPSSSSSHSLRSPAVVKGAASLPVQSGSFFCRIKNLDTGKEFVVDEFGEDDAWDSFSDLQTGRRLTVEEFERCVGYSPIIKELMRRETVGQPSSPTTTISCSPSVNAAHSKSGKSVKKKGAGGGGSGVGGGNWLKNIREVANSVTGRIVETAERSSSFSSASLSTSSASELMKVHQHGKSYKELTGLYMSQAIQAHQGSIWTIRFSPDARYLASAGEDRVIHVWQVHECGVSESSSSRMDASGNSGRLRPPVLNGSPGRHGERKRKGKISSLSRRGSVPEYVVVPETIFSLSEKPVCSFQGHLDDVLDLSWSKSQHLLSSSMDKTVRLWNMESKTCLKLFAHNDYVTCIQFNPIDDRYFISGSLDAKVRIWSIPDRQVVDYTDLHEMVTAACYTPDGQGALVGSHKGSCRLYTTSGCKLRQKGQIDIQNKKKKSHAKKITGFQFAPGDPSEVLITSADSQIRVFDGVDIIHKFRGFRNTSSQISASFTADGKYVVCASEDSQVYIWKRDELRQMSGGSSSGGGVKNKSWMTNRSHEHFHCRDVSVAIPWPGSSKFEPPPLPLRLMGHHHESHSRRNASSRASTSSAISAQEDIFVSSRSHGSPLCKKNSSQRALQNAEQDHRKPSYSESSIGGISLASASRLLKSGVLSTISSSTIPPPSWWWYDGGSNRISSIQEPAAWGLVFVTAGLGGEIRVYQNFGLPLRLNRQATFF